MLVRRGLLPARALPGNTIETGVFLEETFPARASHFSAGRWQYKFLTNATCCSALLHVHTGAPGGRGLRKCVCVCVCGALCM